MIRKHILFVYQNGLPVLGEPLGLDLDEHGVYMTLWTGAGSIRITPPAGWWYNSNTGWHEA